MKHVHFIGIGGSGLSAMAIVLLERGVIVSGSDRQESPIIEQVRAKGAQVYIGHAPDHISGADLIVRSSAIREDNPEVQAGIKAKIPVLKRSEFLDQLTVGYRVIAVAGTHGKTTTTAMVAWILHSLELDPSFIIGGISSNLGKNAHAGTGAWFVIEADEYDYMFLGLTPQLALVTNIEHDHPDCYPSRVDYEQAFRAFAQKVLPNGSLIVCVDDPGSAQLGQMDGFNKKVLTYGISTGDTTTLPAYQANNLTLNEKGGFDFAAEIFRQETSSRKPSKSALVSLQVPGEHNVRNALGALALVDSIGISWEKAIPALEAFSGTSRRFEICGEINGITFIDDYAHHPSEISATLRAARARFPSRSIWAVWQPHTYSRTHLLADQFETAFGERTNPLADHILITKIYAARESETLQQVSASQIAERMSEYHQLPDVHYLPELSQITDYLFDNLQPDDVLIVLSAGDADQINRQLQQTLRSKNPIPLHSPKKIDQYAFLGDQLKREVHLARYTASRVGGPVDGLIEARSAQELAKITCKLWEHACSFVIIGGGSNILVSDKGFRGIVVVNKAHQLRFDDAANPPQVWAESGVNLGALARLSAQRGLSGLEWAAGIPGTIGGAVVGNAGAHGSDMSDNLIMAEILHQDGQIEQWPMERFEFTYRGSCLKQQGTDRVRSSLQTPIAVVLSAILRFERSSVELAQGRINTLVAHRRRTQPPGASMGSMFKNPMGDYAGRLIEATGLKGYRIGDAEISHLHANFFLNLGNAKAAEIKELIDVAQRKVFEEFGVELELEIELLGDW